MALPNQWAANQAYIKPEIEHAHNVLEVRNFNFQIPQSPKGVHIAIVVPVINRNSISALNAELARTHGIAAPENHDAAKLRMLEWNTRGIHLIPITQTVLEDKGPWKGFTTKILECLERDSSSIFVFAGTSAYEDSCTSKATKIVLEPKSKVESPFNDSDLFLKLEECLGEREDLPKITWD